MITFSIGSGVKTITPMSVLPEITDPVTIDGTTQPGFSGSPIIELDASSCWLPGGCVNIIAGSSAVRGLVINRPGTSCISVTTNGNNISEFSHCAPVTGNFICAQMDLFPIPFGLGIIPQDTFVNKLLTVRNVGTAPLMVTPMQPSAPEFQLVSPTGPFTLERGQRRSLTVRFRPRMVGQFRSMMMIRSNDEAQPMVNVELMGASCSPPMLAPLAETVQIKLGTTKDIPLAVMDGQAYCQYKFSLSPALPFVTLTDKKDGTGVLRLAPTVPPTGGQGIGTYRLTVMVSDGSSPPQSHSRAITIMVSR
jgi:hypothetical protein